MFLYTVQSCVSVVFNVAVFTDTVLSAIGIIA